jgi:hypothetical protein
MSPTVTSTLRFRFLRATKKTLPHNGLRRHGGSPPATETSRLAEIVPVRTGERRMAPPGAGCNDFWETLGVPKAVDCVLMHQRRSVGRPRSFAAAR